MLGKLFGRKPSLVSRDGDRYEASLRVMSRDLPGYRGVTLDISSSGLQLETNGILEVGSEPELKFEFDRGELESFSCKARVVWSKQDGDNERNFHSGLMFVPSTDDEKRLLSRMSTVLQTRSETDLKTLLDQALRMDPELEASFAEIAGHRTDPVPAAQASPAPSAPTGPPPPPPSRPAPAAQAPAANQSPPYPGWYMPLQVYVEGYTWNRASKTLHLGIKEGNDVHNLFFPDCQLFQVLEPAADRLIVAMYSTHTSPATRKIAMSEDTTKYRHYRFVGEAGQGLMDVVATSCKAVP